MKKSWDVNSLIGIFLKLKSFYPISNVVNTDNDIIVDDNNSFDVDSDESNESNVDEDGDDISEDEHDYERNFAANAQSSRIHAQQVRDMIMNFCLVAKKNSKKS